jgi:hypothetical protein
VEGVLEHVSELSPARSRSISEHAEQARASKPATMRRDRARCRRGFARVAPAGPLAAQGDLQALRVPSPARSDRHARRGAARVGARSSRVGGGSLAGRRALGAPRPCGHRRRRRQCGRRDGHRSRRRQPAK